MGGGSQGRVRDEGCHVLIGGSKAKPGTKTFKNARTLSSIPELRIHSGTVTPSQAQQWTAAGRQHLDAKLARCRGWSSLAPAACHCQLLAAAMDVKSVVTTRRKLPTSTPSSQTVYRYHLAIFNKTTNQHDFLSDYERASRIHLSRTTSGLRNDTPSFRAFSRFPTL